MRSSITMHLMSSSITIPIQPRHQHEYFSLGLEGQAREWFDNLGRGAFTYFAEFLMEFLYVGVMTRRTSSPLSRLQYMRILC